MLLKLVLMSKSINELQNHASIYLISSPVTLPQCSLGSLQLSEAWAIAKESQGQAVAVAAMKQGEPGCSEARG